MSAITTSSRGSKARFDRSKLPPANVFYHGEFSGSLGRPNSKDWRQVRSGCPFHASSSKRSFYVNTKSGAFKCFAPECDTSGGDIIAFVMFRDKCDFPTACKALGAWHERGAAEPTDTINTAFLVFEFVENGVRYSAEVRDDPRNWRQALIRIRHNAADRLKELKNGDPENYQGEREHEWFVMERAWSLLQELEGRI